VCVGRDELVVKTARADNEEDEDGGHETRNWQEIDLEYLA
jgi:hypothetical protein